MIRTFLATMTLAAALSFGQVSAHPGGHGGLPITEGAALGIGASVAAYLVETDAGLGFGKLEPTWKGLPDDAVRIHQKGEGYYIVSIHNAGEGRTLYVLMSATGDVYDANFTGKFEGVN